MNKKRCKRALLAGAVILASSFSVRVFAQVRGSGGDPLEQLPKNQVAKPAVTVDVPQANGLEQQGQQTFVPHHVDIAGVKSLPFADVQAEFAPFLEKETSIGQLTAAAKRVTEHYKAAGFIMSFAYIPKQLFEGGRVRVEVVEGFVDLIKIQGDPGNSESHIRAIAEGLEKDRPLTALTFARVTTLLARLPGVSIAAKVTPPTTTDGAADLVLTVKRRPFTVGTALDTYQPGARLLATATANSLTPLGDQLTVSALLSRDSNSDQFYSVAEAIPIGNQGLLFNASAYHYTSQDEIALAPALTGVDREITDRVAFLASNPIDIGTNYQIVGTAGVEVAHDFDRFSVIGLQANQRADLRMIHLGVASNLTTASHAIAASANLYEGIPGLGESDSPGDPIDLRFARIVLNVKDKMTWFSNLETTVAMQGQFTGNRLASSEQIGFGAGQFGQGYPISDIVGDHGVGASVEFGYAVKTPTWPVDRVEPYIMFDTAKAYDNNGGPTMPRIASAAIGGRVTNATHFSVDLNVARPIAALPIDSTHRDLRVNLLFSYQTD